MAELGEAAEPAQRPAGEDGEGAGGGDPARPAAGDLAITLGGLERFWREHVVYADWTAEEERAFRVQARKVTAGLLTGFLLAGLLALVLTWPTDEVLLRGRVPALAFNLWRSVFLVTGSLLVLILRLPRLAEAGWTHPVAIAVLLLDAAVAGYASGWMGGLHLPYFYIVYALGGVGLVFHIRLLNRMLVTFGLTVAFAGAFFLPFPANLEGPFLVSVGLVVGVLDLLFICIGHFIYDQSRVNFRQRLAIEEAHDRNEALLLNILPAPIADRLRAEQRPIADAFPAVTVLFADIVGFTPLSDALPPEQLVAFLNRLFSAFDGLVDRHGLEKIKTIGDAYMVVGGLPAPRPDHAEAVGSLALEMLETAAALEGPDGTPVRLRIGIHTGPAVAGVIGVRKFSYDLWGDTVNTASRMESHGVPGRICVSEQTFHALEGRFCFEPRGEVEVKGKGRLATWLLTRRRTG